MAVVYTAENYSLVLLEIVVNTSAGAIPAEMLYVPVDIPDGIHLETLDTRTLSPHWFDYPAPAECQHIGDAWAKGGATVGLVVPSAVARIEHNVLLNPRHPDFARLKIGAPQNVSIDSRLMTTR
jgi:RES domain-containing protein